MNHLDTISDPYFHLGCAIVKQAVDDYRFADKRIRMGAASLDNVKLKRECEKFFRGPLPEFYCDIEGTVILRRLKGSV